MRDDLKVELTARALFLLFDVLDQYIAEGYNASNSLEEARKRLQELDDKLKNQEPL